MNFDLVQLFQNGGDLRLFENGRTSTAAAAAFDTQLPPPPYPSMVGYVVVFIVGIEHRPGAIRAREKVRLVREPLNPSGANALKVLNKRNSRVGQVERFAAAVLSPLIDSKSINVEGIVSDPDYWSDDNLAIPCQVNIFARDGDLSGITAAITRGGLRFIPQSYPSLELTVVEAGERIISRKSLKSIDKVFQLMDERVTEMAAMGPLEPNKGVVTTELMAHQKEALGWLLHRENSSDFQPFWAVKDGLFVNELTDCKIEARPEPIRGGIFADDIGTGKTLSLISLIAFDQCGLGDGVDVDHTVDSEFSGDKRAMNWANIARKKPRVESNEDTVGHKTTLVICPPSVLSTWATELREHTRQGSLKVYMYYGERTQDPEVLKSFDIVLTTYSTLGVDSRESLSPLCRTKWWRVILDDAHALKNVDARQTLAVMSLQAERRWVVTGMIIRNNSFDLFPLVKFLRYDPFSYECCWARLIQRPLSRGDPRGDSRLKVLLATLSLMRSKEKVAIDLPSKVIETCFVELCSKELELYVQAEEEGRNLFESFNGDVQRNYPYFLSLIIRLRQICTNTAFCRPDFKPLIASTHIKGLQDVSKMPELLEKMIALLQEGEDLECPICISPPSEAVITFCAHIFCRRCILKTIKCASRCCPMCRHPLSESDLYAAPPESSEKGGSLSSKGLCLSKLLAESKEKNPTGKSVVFSQFRKMLLSLEEPLKASGLKVLLLDWTMDARRRGDVIEKFNASGVDAPTVLLTSLKASTGVNLTAASTVYLLEPWWNPVLEEQAIDRVHRIGQKETVKIVRIIAKNSIEERVLDLQERKRNLEKEGFGRKGTKERRELNEDDVRLLLAL